MATGNNMTSGRDEMISRLEAAMPKIEAVRELCRAPSVSIGVLHQGEVVFRQSIGLRDVEGNLQANSDTAYQIGSCSKLFTATAVGLLKEKGELIWTDKIQDHLPDFDPIQDRDIGKAATIKDLCRHCSGIATGNAIYMGPGVTTVVKGENHLALVNRLPTSNKDGQRFNRAWCYSNAAYGLLADIIEKSSGAQFATFLKDRLCGPLRLTQTLLTEADVKHNANVAHGYVQRADGTWARIGNEHTTENYGPVLASIGIRTSVNDMLKYLAAVMDRYDHENESTPSPELIDKCQENPLREISSMWKYGWTRPHDDSFENKTTYKNGWLRTTMPTSALGMLSYNRVRRKEYIIGKKSGPRTLYGHSGIANGFVATAYLIPDSHTAVVAFSNAAGPGDAAETASQILLQAIFDLKPHIDLLPSLEESISNGLKEHETMVKDWREHRDVSQYDETTSKEFLGTYVGFGVSHIHIIHSDTSESGLAVKFADKEDSQCDLEPYNKDALSFLPLDHHERLERGMLDWDYWEVGVFTFIREGMALDLDLPASKPDSPSAEAVATNSTEPSTHLAESETRKPVVGLRWKWDEYDNPGLWVKNK